MSKKIIMFTMIGILIDQVIKIIVSNFIPLYDTITVIPNFFNLTYVQNTGAAFSLFLGRRFFFVIIALIAIYLVYRFFIKDKQLRTHEIILYSMLLSGIIGNMVDRVIFGYVIDYLSFTIFNYNFAIFNLADSLIVVSVIILLVKYIKEDICKNT